MTFWEDSQRYLYLPRLSGQGVLQNAIIKGAGTRDFFGTAYGQSGEKFDGFKFGDDNIQMDDTLLLIEPEAATAYEAAMAAALANANLVVSGEGTKTPDQASQIREENGTVTKPQLGTGAVSATKKARAYYGSADINPSTAKMGLVQVAEEIISLLASDPTAALRITVEINAEFPDGASDQLKRAVSENASSLQFGTSEWE
ncbi:MAG: hypothetical protein R3C12_21485 [Planctomycetaceae bacterium]